MIIAAGAEWMGNIDVMVAAIKMAATPDHTGPGSGAQGRRAPDNRFVCLPPVAHHFDPPTPVRGANQHLPGPPTDDELRAQRCGSRWSLRCTRSLASLCSCGHAAC